MEVAAGSVKRERGGISFSVHCCGEHRLSGHIQHAGTMTESELEDYIDRVLTEAAEGHEAEVGAAKHLEKKLADLKALDPNCEDCK